MAGSEGRNLSGGLECVGKSNACKTRVVRHIETNRGALFGPLGGPYTGATEEDLRDIWAQLMPRGNMVVQSLCGGHFTDFFDRNEDGGEGGDGGEEAWMQLLHYSLEDLAYCCEECTPV